MTRKNRKASSRREVQRKGRSKGNISNKRSFDANNESDAVVVKVPKTPLKHSEESEEDEEIEADSESEASDEGEVKSECIVGHVAGVKKRPTFCIKQTDFVHLTPEQASRLLHPNPCCFLTTIPTVTKNDALRIQPLNAMTLSWLAPANNYGGFVFVIHKSRYSADSIVNGSGKFTLSVAHAGLRDVLLACGKVSGKTTDKFKGSVEGLRAVPASLLCAAKDKAAEFTAKNSFSVLGNDSDSDSEGSSRKKSNQKFDLNDHKAHTIAPPVQGTVAHLACRMVQHCDAADAGHWLITAQIDDAFVHTSFWDGKCFQPKFPDLPPLVSFLGSQRFGFIVAEE